MDLPGWLPCRTVHRRMLGETTRVFLLCAAFLLAVIILGQGVRTRDLLIGLRLGLGEFLLVLFYMSPVFMVLIIPFACMLSIFLTMLRMNAERELTALKAGGVSLLQLLPAPMFFASLCCALTMFISLYGISWSGERFRSTLLQLARDRAELNLRPGVFNTDIKGLTVFVRRIDPKSKEMRGIMVEDAGQGEGRRFVIFAPRGGIITDNIQGDLLFRLYDGKLYRLGQDALGVLEFAEYNIRVSLEKLFANIELGRVKPREMSWGELRRLEQEYAEQKLSPRYGRKILAEIQKRLAMPVSSLVFGLFALPLAAGFEGAGRQTGVALALCAFLFYYSLSSLGIALSESGALSPVISAWGPNVIFLLAGLIGLFFAARERMPDILSKLGGKLKKLRAGKTA